MSFEEFMTSAAGRAVAGVVIAALAILIIELNYRWLFKRFFDIVFSLISLIICSPALIAGAVISKKRAGEVCEKNAYLGKGGKIIFLRSFAGINKGIKNLPRLADILSGKISFVGIAPLPLADGALMDDKAMERTGAKPAVFNHLCLRADENITFEEAFALDALYAKKCRFFKDIYIVIKCLVLAVRGEKRSYLGETKCGSYASALLARGTITEEDVARANGAAEEAIAESRKMLEVKKKKYS